MPNPSDNRRTGSRYDLRGAESARGMLTSHEENVRYWKPKNDLSERLFAAVVEGKIWTDDEVAQARFKRKKLAQYNFFRVSARIIEGWFRDMAFDVSYTPVRDDTQDKELVEGLEGLRIQEANVNDDANKDARTFIEAWVGPNAWQEIWVDAAPGLPAVTRCGNRDRFSIYPDPRSKEPITRDDAEFIDVVDWMNPDQILAALPKYAEKLERMMAARYEDKVQGTGDGSFEQTSHSRDRQHETQDYRDGRYKVVTRYYRAMSKSGEYWDTDNQQWVPVESRDQAPSSATFRSCGRDELWWMVAIPGISKYDHFTNERYYLQLRHPRTGKVMFPFVELAAEITNGQIGGFAEHELEPIRGFNAMLGNVLNSAKHSSSQAKLIDPDAFKDEKEAKQAALYHSDADRTFKVKPGRLQDAMKPIEHSSVSGDTYRGMDIAKSAFDEISSTPPSLQGQREANESGVLYSQRIEQSVMQLKPFMMNYIKFLERKYLIRYMMWREYYTDEQLIPLMNPSPEQQEAGVQSVQLNQPVGVGYEMAADGTIQLVQRLKNDVNAILYDITVRLSKRTPTERMKTLARLTELSNSPMAARDPGIGSVIFMAAADLADLPEKYQQMLRSQSQFISQKQAQESEQTQQAAQAQAQLTMERAKAENMKIQAEAQKTGTDAMAKQADVAKTQAETDSIQVDTQVDARLAQLDARLKELEIKEKELGIAQAGVGLTHSVHKQAALELDSEPV